MLEARDGKAALKEIKASEVDLVVPELKVVAISGMFEGWCLRVADRLGAEVTLAKPIQPDNLRDVVRWLLAKDLSTHQASRVESKKHLEV